jgi:hypothetical protein
MALGQAQRPLETKGGQKLDVDESTEQTALATSDRTVAMILEEMLIELRKIRMAQELQIGEEIGDVDR